MVATWSSHFIACDWGKTRTLVRGRPSLFVPFEHASKLLERVPNHVSPSVRNEYARVFSVLAGGDLSGLVWDHGDDPRAPDTPQSLSGDGAGAGAARVTAGKGAAGRGDGEGSSSSTAGKGAAGRGDGEGSSSATAGKGAAGRGDAGRASVPARLPQTSDSKLIFSPEKAFMKLPVPGEGEIHIFRDPVMVNTEFVRCTEVLSIACKVQPEEASNVSLFLLISFRSRFLTCSRFLQVLCEVCRSAGGRIGFNAKLIRYYRISEEDPTCLARYCLTFACLQCWHAYVMFVRASQVCYSRRRHGHARGGRR